MNRLEALILQDPGQRGIAALQVAGDLEAAAALLRKARRPLVLTGFAVGPQGVAETDGPPGALFLGRALARLGKTVTYATHRSCEPVLRAGLQTLGLDGALAVVAPSQSPGPLLRQTEADLVIAIELPGRSADGQYYNMRGLPITERTAPLDELLLLAAGQSIPTVGVGDGGNEAGMGRVKERVAAAVPNGGLIASVVPAERLVTAGTSNWGAYGLIAALDRDLLPDPAEEVRLLTALVEAGALDGARLSPTVTVDGIDPAVYLQVLRDLKGAMVEGD